MAFSDKTINVRITSTSSGPIQLQRSYGPKVEIWEKSANVILSSGDSIGTPDGGYTVYFPSGTAINGLCSQRLFVTCDPGAVTALDYIQFMFDHLWYCVFVAGDYSDPVDLGIHG